MPKQDNTDWSVCVWKRRVDDFQMCYMHSQFTCELLCKLNIIDLIAWKIRLNAALNSLVALSNRRNIAWHIASDWDSTTLKKHQL